MSKINDGGPAFPMVVVNGFNSVSPEGGMSLRDWFAGMAMQGCIAADASGGISNGNITEFAYKVADAMIAERDE